MKDPLLVNKLAAALLVALLVFMVVGLVSESLISPKPLEKNAYIVVGVPAPEAGASGEAKSAAGATAVIEPIAPLLAKASIEAGQDTAKKCQTCHDFSKGGANKIGPNLWGIIGKKVASHEGYSYSAALKKMADQSWDYERLNQFLAAPQAVAPGTKMTFAGQAKAEDRANIILYLRSLSDSPPKLP